MTDSGRRLFALLLLAAATACASWRGEQRTISLEAHESYQPDRRDYLAFRAAHRDQLLEPNYLAFMVHRFPTDSPTGDVLVFCRWPDERMPLKVYVAPPVIPEELQDEFSPVDPKVFVEAVEGALSSWERELEGVVRFAQVESSDQADLRLLLLGEQAPSPNPEIQVLGKTEALRHACRSRGWDPDENRMRVSFAVSELVVYVADGFGLLTARQVEGIALHEIGHALGMRGHSPIEGDLMYPVVRDRITEHFSTQDIQSFLSLYRIPNGSHYGWVMRGVSPLRPPPAPPSGAPLLELAPHVNARFSFAIRIPAGWIGVETANGFFAANGPLWDHDASIEIFVSPYETIEAFEERYGRSLFRGIWLRHRAPMVVYGRRALRVSAEDPQGRFAEDYTLVELGDSRVMMILTQCPVAEQEAWAPWLNASLATLDLWTDPGSGRARPGSR